MLVLFLLTPAVLGAFATTRGVRLAVVPLVVFAGQISLWFAYYATDWFSNPGLGGALVVVILPALCSFVVAMVAVVISFKPSQRAEVTR